MRNKTTTVQLSLVIGLATAVISALWLTIAKPDIVLLAAQRRICERRLVLLSVFSGFCAFVVAVLILTDDEKNPKPRNY